MLVFNRVEENKEKNEVSYIVNKFDLEDIGEERRKSLLAPVVLESLAKQYPEKKEELMTIRRKLKRYAETNFDNAEAQLVLYGIDQILGELDKVLNNEK